MLPKQHIREVEPCAACFVVVHQVVVPGGDMQTCAEGAVHLHGTGIPIGEGIGIGVYLYLVAEEWREHRLLQVRLAARGKPYLVGAEKAEDEGGLFAFDDSYSF